MRPSPERREPCRKSVSVRRSGTLHKEQERDCEISLFMA